MPLDDAGDMLTRVVERLRKLSPADDPVLCFDQLLGLLHGHQLPAVPQRNMGGLIDIGAFQRGKQPK